MTTIEDRIRESLHGYAAIPEPPADLAGAAISGARTVRRRRLAAATVAAALAVSLVAGVAALGARGGHHGVPPKPAAPVPSVTASASPSAWGVDVWGDDKGLRTADGRQLPLSDEARIRMIARVPDGWLITADQGDRLLRVDGSTVQLGIGGETAVSADGRSVAWVNGTTAWAARLAADGLHDKKKTAVPAKTSAVTWIGKRVVLAHAYAPWCCGNDHQEHDVWDPARGAFAPHWTRDIAPVYGPMPDGGIAYGQVEADDKTNGAGCLVKLDGVKDMSVTKRTCLPGLGWASLVSVLSPDSRRLAELRRPTGSEPDSVMVIDLATEAQISTCPAERPLAWEDHDHFLARTGDARVVRCTVGKTDATVVPDVTEQFLASNAELRFVPRYGVG